MTHIQPSTRLDQETIDAITRMRKFHWEKTWTFWPRKDRITHKRMRMCSMCYKGTRIIHSPGEDLLLTRYMTPESFMFEHLAGRI